MMTPFALRPRARFYGWPGNYLRLANDFLHGLLRRGRAVEHLEAMFARKIGTRFAVAMPQARMGIYLALRGLIEPGQEVVLSPYTIYDVVNMVVCAGGRPVFADVDRASCNIDPAQVRRLVHPGTGAVLITHLHGLACDVDAIASVCGEHGVPLLEDSAQALGTRVGGRSVGSFGKAGIFSFGMAKNVNAIYGGMVTTDDPELHESICRTLEAYPQQETSVLFQRAAFCLAGDLATAAIPFGLFTSHVFRFGYLRGVDAVNRRIRGEGNPIYRESVPPGYLRRLTPGQARLVLDQLDAVDDHSRQRREVAHLYHVGLADIPQILLPPLREDGSHIYLTYPIQVPDRNDLLRFLVHRRRDLTIQHMGNTADYDCYARFHRDCPRARETGQSVLILPTYPGYGSPEVRRNIRGIRDYFGSR